LIAPVSSVVPEMWLFPLIKAFAIAILGGIGSLVGSVIASFVIGYAEIVGSFLISEQLTEMVALAVIVLVLLFKPSGIMGYKLR
jgi:branched-chain amino acid transport system permease protein